MSYTLDTEISILGCGNMARAIFGGAYIDQNAKNVFLYNPTTSKAADLAQIIGGTQTNLQDAWSKTIGFLSFKPQKLNDFLEEVKVFDKKPKAYISVLAGASLTDLAQKLNHTNIIRVMPNTPAMIGEGVHLISAHPNAEPEFVKMTVELFSKVGLTYVCDENMLDNLTLITGSGPAFVFEFFNSLQSISENLGASREDAKKLVLQLLKGSILYLEQSDLDAVDLRKQVTSKGGVTAKALESLIPDLHNMLDVGVKNGINHLSQLSK